jgi:ankyrin repeat protein
MSPLLSSGTEHKFEPHNSTTPKSCAACNAYIWGKSLRCRFCRLHVHSKCRGAVAACAHHASASVPSLLVASNSVLNSSNSNSSAAAAAASSFGVSVTVVEARGLVPGDHLGSSVNLPTGKDVTALGAALDVYCRVSVGGSLERTFTARRVRQPVWNATFEFELVGTGDELVLELFSADRFAYDEPIGLGIVRIGDVAAGVADRWVPFIDAPAASSGGAPAGEVHVIVKPIREEPLDAQVTLASAVRDGSVRAVTRLLRDSTIDVNAQDAFGYAPLHTAVTMGDGVLRPLLTCARINVNLRNNDGNTPFHYFCAKWRTPNCAPLFELFINKGVKINGQNSTGETPLHKAVMNGFVRLILVRMLLGHRADPNQLTTKGEAPLHYAVHLKREDIILSLVAGGADVTLRGKGGKTPYGLAVDTGETRIARLLSDVKALFDWLAELGLDEYKSSFIEHEIFLPVLPALDDDTLDVLGITALGHRMLLLEACAKLRDRERAGLDLKARRLTINTTPAGLKMEAELNALSHVDAAAGGWLVSAHELEFTELLGEGASGSVYKGLFRERACAIKVLSSEARTEKRINEFKREFEILAAVRSPYLVQFYAASLEPQLCMVIEYCAKGSLFHVMIRPPVPPPEPAKLAESAIAASSTIEAIDTGLLDWRWFFDIAMDAVRGIDVLHNWQPPIVHRDLKSLNLLVDAAGRAKVCDFGLSRFTTGSNLMSLQKCRGTLAYTAPEMMDAVQFQPSADVYALGMVFWEMAVRLAKGVYERPYEEFPNLTLDFQILMRASQGVRPTLPEALPVPVRALIQRMWSADATVRPLSADLMVELNGLRRTWESERSAWDTILSHYNGLHVSGSGAAVVISDDGSEIELKLAASKEQTSPRSSVLLERAGSPTAAQRMLRRDLIRGVSAADDWRRPSAVGSAISRARKPNSSPSSPAVAVAGSESPTTASSPGSRRSTLQRNARVKTGLAAKAVSLRTDSGGLAAPATAGVVEIDDDDDDNRDDDDDVGTQASTLPLTDIVDGGAPASNDVAVVVSDDNDNDDDDDDDSDSSFDVESISASISRSATLSKPAPVDVVVESSIAPTDIVVEPLTVSDGPPTPKTVASEIDIATDILSRRTISSTNVWGDLLQQHQQQQDQQQLAPQTNVRSKSPRHRSDSQSETNVRPKSPRHRSDSGQSETNVRPKSPRHRSDSGQSGAPPLPSSPAPSHLSRQAQTLRFSAAASEDTPPRRDSGNKPLPPNRPPPNKMNIASRSTPHLSVSGSVVDASDDVPPPPPPQSAKKAIRAELRNATEARSDRTGERSPTRAKSPRPGESLSERTDRPNRRVSTGTKSSSSGSGRTRRDNGRKGGRRPRHRRRQGTDGGGGQQQADDDSGSDNDESDEDSVPFRPGTPESKPAPPSGPRPTN